MSEESVSVCPSCGSRDVLPNGLSVTYRRVERTGERDPQHQPRSAEYRYRCTSCRHEFSVVEPLDD